MSEEFLAKMFEEYSMKKFKGFFSNIDCDEMLSKRQHHFNDYFPLKNHEAYDFYFKGRDRQADDITHLSQSEVHQLYLDNENADHEFQSKIKTIAYNRDSEITNEDEIQLESLPEKKVISEEEESLVEK